jgi:hypothetical protein
MTALNRKFAALTRYALRDNRDLAFERPFCKHLLIMVFQPEIMPSKGRLLRWLIPPPTAQRLKQSR